MRPFTIGGSSWNRDEGRAENGFSKGMGSWNRVNREDGAVLAEGPSACPGGKLSPRRTSSSQALCLRLVLQRTLRLIFGVGK